MRWFEPKKKKWLSKQVVSVITMDDVWILETQYSRGENMKRHAGEVLASWPEL